MTWEPQDNLSEDLIRDFEETFWQAVKTKDEEVLGPALTYGKATIANIVDKERRSALHFAAALNQVDLVERLLAAGARSSLCALSSAAQTECSWPAHDEAAQVQARLCCADTNVLVVHAMHPGRSCMSQPAHRPRRWATPPTGKATNRTHDLRRRGRQRVRTRRHHAAAHGGISQ
jgi:hypothetical protein